MESVGDALIVVDGIGATFDTGLVRVTVGGTSRDAGEPSGDDSVGLAAWTGEGTKAVRGDGGGGGGTKEIAGGAAGGETTGRFMLNNFLSCLTTREPKVVRRSLVKVQRSRRSVVDGKGDIVSLEKRSRRRRVSFIIDSHYC